MLLKEDVIDLCITQVYNIMYIRVLLLNAMNELPMCI